MSLLFQGKNLRVESLKRGDYFKPITFTGYGSIAGALNVQTRTLNAGTVQINAQGDVTGVKTLTASGDITTDAKFRINEFQATGRVETSGPIMNLSGGYYDYSSVSPLNEDYGSATPYYTRGYPTLLPTAYPASAFLWGVDTASGTQAHLLITQGTKTFTYAFGVGSYTAASLVQQFNGPQATANQSPLVLSYNAVADRFTLAVDDARGATLEAGIDEPTYLQEFSLRAGSKLLVLLGFLSPEAAAAASPPVPHLPSTGRSLSSTQPTPFRLTAGAAQGFYCGGRNKDATFDHWSPVSQTWVGPNASQSITTHHLKTLSEARLAEGVTNEQVLFETLTASNLVEGYATLTRPVVAGTTDATTGVFTQTVSASSRRAVFSPLFRVTDDGTVLLYDTDANDPVRSQGSRPGKSTLVLRSRDPKAPHAGPSLAFEGSFSNETGGDASSYVYGQVKGVAAPTFSSVGASTSTGGHLVFFTAGTEAFADSAQAVANPREALRINEAQQTILGGTASTGVPPDLGLDPRLLVHGSAVVTRVLQAQAGLYVGTSATLGTTTVAGALAVEGEIRTAGDAYIAGHLYAGGVTFSSVGVTDFSTANITADTATLTSLAFTSAAGHSLSLSSSADVAGTLTAQHAALTTLGASHAALTTLGVSSSLTAAYCEVATLVVDNVSITGGLALTSMSIASLTTIAANITGTLTSASGSIADLTSASASVTGTLSVNTANVTGTLTAPSASITCTLSVNAANVTGTLTAASAGVTGTLTTALANVTGTLTAVAGNITGTLTTAALSAPAADVAALTASAATVAGTLTSAHLHAPTVTVPTALWANHATLTSLTSASANITNTLTSAFANITNTLTSASANINSTLTSASANITNTLTSASANITGTLTSASANIPGTLSANPADVTGALTAASASVASLTSASASITGTLTANAATVTGTLTSVHANITGTLTSPSGNITNTLTSATLHVPTLLAAQHATLTSLTSVSANVTGTLTAADATLASATLLGGAATLSSVTATDATFSTLTVSAGGTVSDLSLLSAANASFTSAAVHQLTCTTASFSTITGCHSATATSITAAGLTVTGLATCLRLTCTDTVTGLTAQKVTVQSALDATNAVVSTKRVKAHTVEYSYDDEALPTFSSKQAGYQAAYTMGAGVALTDGTPTNVGTTSAVTLGMGVWDLSAAVHLRAPTGTVSLSSVRIGFASLATAFDAYSIAPTALRYQTDTAPRPLADTDTVTPILTCAQTVQVAAATDVYLLADCRFAGTGTLEAGADTHLMVRRVA